MIVNEKIGKIKLELLKEEFIKQIKDSYTLNLSMVLLEEFENLQQENKLLKDVIDEIRDRITIKLGRYINEKDYVIDDVALDELLQILDKVKD